jgi:hypothetical protein
LELFGGQLPPQLPSAFFVLFKNIALVQVGTLAMLRAESDAEGSCVGMKLCALQVFFFVLFFLALQVANCRCKSICFTS